jgi:LCP family protein required for cell wall assembly
LKRSKLVKILGVFLCILILSGIGLGVFGYDYFKRVFQNPDLAFEKRNDDIQVTLNPSNGPEQVVSFDHNVVNIALLGRDKDETQSYVQETNRGYNIDAIILLTVNKQTKNVSMMSIPRDTQVDIRKIDEDGNVTKTYKGKITDSFVQGGTTDAQRYDTFRGTISNLLTSSGITVPVDYFISVEMDGFGAITDSLGGVPVTLERDVPRIGKAGDSVVLNGQEALHFVRVRKAYSDSDFSRAKNQQLYIKGMATRIKELGAVATATTLYNEFQDYVDTNLNLEQILALASILVNLDVDNMNHYVLEASNIVNEQVIIDWSKAKDYLLDVMYN